MDTAVPMPGIVEAIPDAASSIAPLKSPFINRCPANNNPAPIPTKGIFFNNPLPSAFAPTFAIALPPTFAAIFLAPFFSNAFPALLPTFARVLPPFINFPADLPTLPRPLPSLPILPRALPAVLPFLLKNTFAFLPSLDLRKFLNLLKVFPRLCRIFPPLLFLSPLFLPCSGAFIEGCADAATPVLKFSNFCFNPILNAGFGVSDIPNILFNLLASDNTLALAGDAGSVCKKPCDELMSNDAPSLYTASIDLLNFDSGMIASGSPPSPISATVRLFVIAPSLRLTDGFFS